MTGVNVGLNNSVELEYAESMLLSLFNAVQHKLLTDMKPTTDGAYCIAGIADVSAASDIIRVEYV